MGGIDKGLQLFRGEPLVRHAVRRLQSQAGDLMGGLMLNANRNLDHYRRLGLPVWPDPVPDHPGPLAGFLAGLQRCPTDYLLTTPCDCPLFPLDLARRLASAFEQPDIDMAVAASLGEGGEVQPEPVFCLMRRSLLQSLEGFVRDGGRRVGQWTGLHRTVLVPFECPADGPDAFCNANTLDELQALENGDAPPLPPLMT